VSGDRLVDEMAARLAATTRRRLEIHQLLGLLVELRPELATDALRYQRLGDALAELERRELVAPSNERARQLGADLPSSVTLLTTPARARRDNPALRFPWVEEMAWVASIRVLPAEQLHRLCRLSDWIAANRGRSPIPERERSLEIFAQDKVLGRLVDGILGNRPAVVEALAIERCHPPMAVAAVEGSLGRTVLVVENGTPFHSALRAARHHVASGVAVEIGWIAYGAGAQLEAIIPSLADLQPRPTAIRYFGDLDREGLRFPAAGAITCEAAGLPPLRPAHRLYELLLDRGKPQKKDQNRPTTWPPDGLAWLGEPLASQLHQTCSVGEWLPQEWVGIETLTADSCWCSLS
jgi:hypothetical protein